MLLQLVNELKIRRSIATYALLSTNFSGTDAAILFLVERHDSESDNAGKMMHPFIGYLRKNQHPAAPAKLDIEA